MHFSPMHPLPSPFYRSTNTPSSWISTRECQSLMLTQGSDIPSWQQDTRCHQAAWAANATSKHTLVFTRRCSSEVPSSPCCLQPVTLILPCTKGLPLQGPHSARAARLPSSTELTNNRWPTVNIQTRAKIITNPAALLLQSPSQLQTTFRQDKMMLCLLSIKGFQVALVLTEALSPATYEL